MKAWLLTLLLFPRGSLTFVPSLVPLNRRMPGTTFCPRLSQRSPTCPASPPQSLPHRNVPTPRLTSTQLYIAAPDQMIAWTSMGMLAIVFGSMPTLQRKFVPKELCRSTQVLAQEVCKFLLAGACFALFLTPTQRRHALASWSIQSWWQGAGLPATLYAFQNYAKLMAYQHLSPVAYCVLNQTKTLSSALFCFLLLGLPQSPLQVVSLFVLLTSALVMEQVIPVRVPVVATERLSSLHWRGRGLNPGKPSRSSKLFACTIAEKGQKIKSPSNWTAPAAHDPAHFTHGVLPLMLASLTSGLAAAVGQKALKRRNLYLYGMELSSASFLIVLGSLLFSSDGQQIRREGWKRHWSAWVWLPVVAHAIGGLLVGLITKYAGAVQKGFALIFGVLLSGIFQKQCLKHEPVTREQVVGGLLACLSLWMHAAFPPAQRAP